MSAPDLPCSPSEILADERRRYREVVPPPRPEWPIDVQIIFREVARRVLDEGVTAHEIVRDCGFGAHEVYTRFKEHLGDGIRGYIVERRMHFAMYLLVKHEDVPVNQIAYTVGYSSPGGFSATFKNYWTCSPTRFRERAQRVKERLKGDSAVPWL